MNSNAPEVAVEPVTPAKHGECVVSRFDGEPDTATKAMRFECVACSAPTDGDFCAACEPEFMADCAGCDTRVERSELVHGQCRACRRYDAETWV